MTTWMGTLLQQVTKQVKKTMEACLTISQSWDMSPLHNRIALGYDVKEQISWSQVEYHRREYTPERAYTHGNQMASHAEEATTHDRDPKSRSTWKNTVNSKNKMVIPLPNAGSSRKPSMNSQIKGEAIEPSKKAPHGPARSRRRRNDPLRSWPRSLTAI
ncbi:hypothetical protein Cgig2_021404 [Carnegiea gigantea]|uniref:Uncharacterized protein n=1 Tax=Carnegiea gigantea TaxID=171969 RepID=A0A9Q1JLP2_9CARY|nr:hypothetical protein Cgig2_021404 [Carnegiea gigantea]